MERFIEIAVVGHSHAVQNQSEREKKPVSFFLPSAPSSCCKLSCTPPLSRRCLLGHHGVLTSPRSSALDRGDFSCPPPVAVGLFVALSPEEDHVAGTPLS
ncbi:hypothetical protein XENOCAPTIV_013774 [Xenoophorus captivus]|uniref:Uncharacterized protein n=1 Tax=Xenoophorus captivus TaxID=1517983 RepID=A0ABV0QN48_9TELE